jgi:hypothetical protein
VALMALMPSLAHAQSSITGTIRDASGAVLPGVTVEAASPVLIEKVRSTVSDDTGVYRLTELLPGTYSLTLNCIWPGDNTTTITWIAPTQNTDGSALSKCPAGTTSGTCLAGFRLYRRVNSTDFTGAEMTQVDDPNATSKLFTGLVVGTHNFVAEAFNANGTASDLSAVTSRVIAASVTRRAGVTLTVNPKPNPPVLQ